MPDAEPDGRNFRTAGRACRSLMEVRGSATPGVPVSAVASPNNTSIPPGGDTAGVGGPEGSVANRLEDEPLRARRVDLRHDVVALIGEHRHRDARGEGLSHLGP